MRIEVKLSLEVPLAEFIQILELQRHLVSEVFSPDALVTGFLTQALLEPIPDDSPATGGTKVTNFPHHLLAGGSENRHRKGTPLRLASDVS